MSPDSSQRCHNSIFPYLSHSAVVILYYLAHPVPNGKKGEDESDPQKKGHAKAATAVAGARLWPQPLVLSQGYKAPLFVVELCFSCGSCLGDVGKWADYEA